MSLLQTRRLVLSLALSLLWPATAFAQTPAGSPTTNPPQVQIKVNFRHCQHRRPEQIRGDVRPCAVGEPDGTVPRQTGAFLQYATGNIVAQLFQTLASTPGKVVQAPLVTTAQQHPGYHPSQHAGSRSGRHGFLPIASRLDPHASHQQRRLNHT